MADIIKSYNDVARRNVDMLDGTYAEVIASISQNITTKFREAFEVYDPVNGGKWQEAKASGDLIYVDGNSAAASYLVISKDPLTAGTESSVTSIGRVGLPIDASAGLHMSQRTLGQEFAVEMIDAGAPLADVSDIAISAISQATTTLTVDTVTAHRLSVGKSIGIRDCSNLLANYPALVVATVTSPTQFTATAGPGGTIPSQTITNPAGAKGFVFFRERLGRAQNGLSEIFENATVTNASLYIRSESGDALPSGTVAGNHSATIGTTASVQLSGNVPYTYSFVPTTEFRLFVQADRTQWADSAVDAVAQTTSRLLRTQVCPDPGLAYKVRIRATNNKSLTVPNAQIVSAAKAGTTTATVTTATAHGLTAGDVIVAYGTRDQTNFANLSAATAVASVVSPTQFTIVWGAAVTATTYGGYVARVQGGNLMSALGAVAQTAQSATLSTLSDGTRQLVLVGSAAWAAPATTIGDLVELVGVRDAVTGTTSLGVDGPWKIASAATTNLTLVLPYAGQRVLPADFGSTNCGGGVIRRTDLRISFLRVFDYERERVELLARPAGDMAAAVPVVMQGGTLPAVTTVTTVSTVTALTGGGVAEDSPAGANPVTVGGVVRTAMAPTTLVAGDAARVTMTSGAAAVTAPYSVPEVSWQTPANVGGLVNTATPLQVKEAAGALIRNYVTQMDLVSEALTNATDFRVREPDLTCSSQTIASNTLTVSATHNLAIGDAVVFTASTVTGISTGVTYYVLTVPAATTITLSATRGGSTLAISGTGVTATFHKVLWQTRIPTTGRPAGQIVFPTPLRGSLNTALQLQTATASGAGSVYASLQGFAAP